MKQNDKSFYSGALWLTISVIILKLIGLIYKIPMHKILGDEGMGYFNSAYTVYTFFYIISTAGIPKAISILVAKNEAECTNSSYNIFKKAFCFFFVFGLVILIIFVFSAPVVSRLIGNSKALISMYAIAPSILFVCAGGVIRGYLTGKMDFSPIAISELLSGFCKLGFGLAFSIIAAKKELPLAQICACSILGITIGSFVALVQLLFSAVKWKRRDSSLAVADDRVIGDILRLAIPITLASAGTGIVNLLDLTFVMNGLTAMNISSTVASALYGNYTTLAVPMFTLVTTLITPITSAVMPEMTKEYKSSGSIADQASRALMLSSFIAAPAAIIFAFFPSELLYLMFERESAVLGAAFLAAMAPSILLIAPLTVLNTAHEAIGRVSIPVISLLGGGAVKLLISFTLIKNDSIGLLAAPLGTAASYLISLVISLSFFKSEINKTDIIKNSLVPILSALAAITPTIIIKYFSTTSLGKIRILVCGMLFAIIYLSFCLIFSKKIRKTLVNFVKINKNTQKRL